MSRATVIAAVIVAALGVLVHAAYFAPLVLALLIAGYLQRPRTSDESSSRSPDR